MVISHTQSEIEAYAKEQEPKHFSEITKEQMKTMWNRCVLAAINYSDEINMSGLSDGNAHDINTALYNALDSEWEKSKKVMNVK